MVAAQRLGVPPERHLVVEDAPARPEATRRAGMRSLALTTSHPRAELDANLVVDLLADLTEAARSRLTDRLVKLPSTRPRP